jgi:hypothetical protein
LFTRLRDVGVRVHVVVSSDDDVSIFGTIPAVLEAADARYVFGIYGKIMYQGDMVENPAYIFHSEVPSRPGTMIESDV